MILQRLTELYARLLEEGEDVAPKGWSTKAINFRVIIDMEGSLKAIQDAATMEGKRRVLPKLITPGDVGITSAIVPEYLNGASAEYLLAFDPQGRSKRTLRIWERFKELHLDARPHVASPGFEAVCRFLETWEPGKLTGEQKALLMEVDGRGVYYLEGEAFPIFEEPEFVAWYNAQQEGADEADERGECLITGEESPLARTHEPWIKGVAETAMGGAKIGGSNWPNFNSYQRQAGHNSPVSKKAAFKYSTALNYLLRSDRRQKTNLGTTTYVYWTQRKTQVESLLSPLFIEDPKDKERLAIQKLRDYLRQARSLQPGEAPEKSAPFFLLGLHGAKARISIRQFAQETVGELEEHLCRFFSDTEIVGIKTPPGLWRILNLTVRDADQVENSQANALLQTVLLGLDYPESLAQKILQRWKQDHGEYAYRADPDRAAVLKAYLIRNRNLLMTTEMNPNEDRVAYRLGRAFAALEKCQRDSNESQGTGASIRHQYLSSAATTPARVFALLLRKQAHWSKNLPEGAQVYYSQLLAEILGHPSLDHVPARLSLEDQAVFFLGYYQQNRDLWSPRAPKAAPSKDNAAPAEAELTQA